jgi:CRISPR-associated protein Cmr5
MANKPIQQTQEQQRAAQAWNDVKSVIGKKWAKEYKSAVKSGPADIQTSGLGQTVAFWRSKKNDEQYQAAYAHVHKWLQHKMGITLDLREWIATTSSNEYRLATVEALAYLGWLKRFADAEIKDS